MPPTNTTTTTTTPADLPPSYAESQATGSSNSSAAAAPAASATRPSRVSPSRQAASGATLSPNTIPVAHRRSMEDEIRPLPEGWIRLFDPKENHQFFVDTKANPPRSIWHHPHDDEQYLSSLTSEQRERIQEEEAKLRNHVSPSSSDEKLPYAPPTSSPHTSQSQQSQHRHTSSIPSASAAAGSSTRKKTLSERLKEKATGMTKEERIVERQKRAEQERQYYEAHIKFRNALAEASRTGQPVFFMKDRDGRDVYVEPPTLPAFVPAYPGAGYGPRPAGQYYGPPGSYGINPFSSGVYANPNARFIRPQQPYGRPYGGGGLGYGIPIAGGLLAGGLLGAATLF